VAKYKLYTSKWNNFEFYLLTPSPIGEGQLVLSEVERG